jgi:hypothetical protein
MPTIVESAKKAGELTRATFQQSGLATQSPMLLGLASGFDIAITLLEESTQVHFNDLSQQSAKKVVDYFEAEANRSAAVDPQVAVFYRAWAEVLRSEYLK